MAILAVPGILAHEVGGKLIVEPPVAAPGEQIAVHGEFLWTEAEVRIDLVERDGDRHFVGSTVTRPDGTLEFAGTVPTEVEDGVHAIEAISGEEFVAVELVIRRPISLVVVALGAVGLAAIIALGLALVRLAARRRGTPKA